MSSWKVKKDPLVSALSKIFLPFMHDFFEHCNNLKNGEPDMNLKIYSSLTCLWCIRYIKVLNGLLKTSFETQRKMHFGRINVHSLKYIFY